MNSSVVVFLALLCVAPVAAVSPVQKVIELLEENKGKVAKDLAAEEAEMEKYTTFCDDELTEKGYAIKDATSAITELEAAVADGESQISDLEAEVAQTGTDMAAKEKELGEATAVRDAGHAAFTKSEEELVGSIDSLERAVMAVKHDSSFLQVRGAKGPSSASKSAIKKAMMAVSRIIDANAVNVERKQVLAGLLQSASAAESEEGDDLRLPTVAAPEADAFESHTGGFLEKLEEMKEKAEGQLSDARTAEMQATHQFNMMAQSLTDSIKVSKEKIATAKSEIEEHTEEAGKAKDELVETTKTKKADEAYVKALTQECSEASAAWEERKKSAGEEMAVIDKAKDILASRVKVFVQTGGKVSAKVAVATARSDGDEAKRSNVLEKLRGLSREFKSYALMEMVSAAAADPFEKIKGLIEEMITKLQNEANEEATQKAFCDEENAKSKASKEDKTMKADKLQARLDKATSTKAELEQSVKELEAEVAALDKGDAEATELRTAENAENVKAAADFKEAAEAVTEAIGVLREYYEGASLVQTSSKKAPPAFGGAKSDAASSIISILEMSGEDFEKLYMETTQEEAEAAAAYKKLMDDNKVSRAAKLAEVKGAESEIKSLDVAIKNGQEDLDTVNKELDAVVAYMDKLKPQCESKAMSYEEKKSRRDAEIEGLKEALSILSA